MIFWDAEIVETLFNFDQWVEVLEDLKLLSWYVKGWNLSLEEEMLYLWYKCGKRVSLNFVYLSFSHLKDAVRDVVVVGIFIVTWLIPQGYFSH